MRVKLVMCENQFVLDSVPGLSEFTNDKKLNAGISSRTIYAKFQSQIVIIQYLSNL